MLKIQSLQDFVANYVQKDICKFKKVDEKPLLQFKKNQPVILKLISPGNSVILPKFVTLGNPKRNKNGPKIDSCGMSYLMGFNLLID